MLKAHRFLTLKLKGELLKTFVILFLFTGSFTAQAADTGQVTFGCSLDLAKNYQDLGKGRLSKAVYFQNKKVLKTAPKEDQDYCGLTAVDPSYAVTCMNLNDCNDPKGSWSSLVGLPGVVEKGTSYQVDAKGTNWGATKEKINNRFGWRLTKDRVILELSCHISHGEKVKEKDGAVLASPPKANFFKAVMGDCIQSTSL